jgi:hypothetical protein
MTTGPVPYIVLATGDGSLLNSDLPEVSSAIFSVHSQMAKT